MKQSSSGKFVRALRAPIASTFVMTALILGSGTSFGAELVAAANMAGAKVAGAQKTGKMHVVFHVTENDPQKWNIVLNNAGNIQKDFGKDNIEIEIVTHGPGIEMLKAESKVTGRLATALDNNIGLFACENTMHNAKVTKADMYGGISFAPSGVTHILKRQSEGWAYLRP